MSAEADGYTSRYVLTGLIQCLSAADSLELLIGGEVKDERLRGRLLARLCDCVHLELANSSHLIDRLLDLLATTPYPRKNSFAYLLQQLYWRCHRRSDAM